MLFSKPILIPPTLRLVFPVNSYNELAFDLANLEKIRSEANKALDGLQKSRNQVREGLNTLRNEWNTPAGSYFFQNLDAEWETGVAKCQKTLEVFVDVLDMTIEYYRAVEEKANALGGLSIGSILPGLRIPVAAPINHL